jgi:hypothetical protein
MLLRRTALTAALLLTACDDGGEGATAAADATAPDAGRTPDGGTPAAAAPDAALPDPDAAMADAAADAAPPEPDAAPLPALTVRPTLEAPPADPLAGAGVESCPVFLDERCAEGRRQRCDVYDTGAGAFTDAPDPLLRRVLLYDRWYDKYHSPDGQTGERVFRGPTPGDMPGAEWGAPAHFAGWAGEGDSAIWTGAALTADIFRYMVTGTEADRGRMEAKTRALLTKFEVTGIPGYLARHHFIQLPPGGPVTDEHFFTHADAPGNRHLPIAPADLERAGLPAAYREGLRDAEGNLVPGVAMWNGHPSIDQYTGPWTAFPLVYPLLRDEETKAQIVHHLTCYLKRLRRVEIVNLQENPDLLGALASFFGEGALRLDPDDIDLLALDEVVAYYHENVNRSNADDFDRSCPDTVALEPTLVIDATAPTWLADIAKFALRLGEEGVRPDNIDHIYIPSLRGGDASHMIHMAAVAWWLTGDEQYRAFLFRELIGRVRADEVMLTMQAFRSPDFCFKFYGDHITYGTHWQLATLLRDDPLFDLTVRAYHEEMWEKALFNHMSAKFGVMYASIAGEAHPDTAARAAAEAVAQLRAFGGNGGVQDAPRRTHHRDRQAVIDALPEGVTVRCPTEAERTTCEQGVRLFGIQLESATITRDCDGRPGECVMADGRCVDGIASSGLSADQRRYADFMWQRSPFDLGESPAVDGMKQSPGRDLSEPYWMARHDGLIEEGRGQVLAWRDDGACE